MIVTGFTDIYKSPDFCLKLNGFDIITYMRVSMSVRAKPFADIQFAESALKQHNVPIAISFGPIRGSIECRALIAIDMNPNISTVSKYVHMRNAIVRLVTPKYYSKTTTRTVSKVAYGATLAILQNNIRVYNYNDVMLSSVRLSVQTIGSTEHFSLTRNVGYRIVKPASY